MAAVQEEAIIQDTAAVQEVDIIQDTAAVQEEDIIQDMAAAQEVDIIQDMVQGTEIREDTTLETPKDLQRLPGDTTLVGDRQLRGLGQVGATHPQPDLPSQPHADPLTTPVHGPASGEDGPCSQTNFLG